MKALDISIVCAVLVHLVGCGNRQEFKSHGQATRSQEAVLGSSSLSSSDSHSIDLESNLRQTSAREENQRTIVTQSAESMERSARRLNQCQQVSSNPGTASVSAVTASVQQTQANVVSLRTRLQNHTMGSRTRRERLVAQLNALHVESRRMDGGGSRNRSQIQSQGSQTLQNEYRRLVALLNEELTQQNNQLDRIQNTYVTPLQDEVAGLLMQVTSICGE